MKVANFTSEAEWIDAALGELRAAVGEARARGRASLALCLAGGLSPVPVYRAMAAMPLAGLAVDLWPGDERVVPAGHASRNGPMIARSFTPCAWGIAPRLRQWPEAGTAEEAPSAAAAYGAELRSSLGPEPRFDLALLGLGADGHTASVFPDPRRASPAYFEASHAEPAELTAVTLSPLPPPIRMTLALGALKAARRRVFLVRGPDKLRAVEMLEAEDPSIPASFLAGPDALVLYLR